MATDKEFGGTADWIKDGHASGGHCSYCGNTATNAMILPGNRTRATCKNCQGKPVQEIEHNRNTDA